MRKTDYGLIGIIAVAVILVLYFVVFEETKYSEIEFNAAQEAADSWKTIFDCELMQGKLISLGTEKDFIGKDIIQSAIEDRMEEIC